jgi:hypothetical protein
MERRRRSIMIAATVLLFVVALVIFRLVFLYLQGSAGP